MFRWILPGSSEKGIAILPELAAIHMQSRIHQSANNSYLILINRLDFWTATHVQRAGQERFRSIHSRPIRVYKWINLAIDIVYVLVDFYHFDAEEMVIIKTFVILLSTAYPRSKCVSRFI